MLFSIEKMMLVQNNVQYGLLWGYRFLKLKTFIFTLHYISIEKFSIEMKRINTFHCRITWRSPGLFVYKLIWSQAHTFVISAQELCESLWPLCWSGPAGWSQYHYCASITTSGMRGSLIIPDTTFLPQRKRTDTKCGWTTSVTSTSTTIKRISLVTVWKWMHSGIKYVFHGLSRRVAERRLLKQQTANVGVE